MRADVSFEDHKILFSGFKSDKDRILFFSLILSLSLLNLGLPMLMAFLNLSRHLFIQKPLIPIITQKLDIQR